MAGACQIAIAAMTASLIGGIWFSHSGNLIPANVPPLFFAQNRHGLLLCNGAPQGRRSEVANQMGSHGANAALGVENSPEGSESLLLEKAHQFEAVLFDLVDRIVFGPIDFKQRQLRLRAALRDGPGVFHGHGGIRPAMHQ